MNDFFLMGAESNYGWCLIGIGSTETFVFGAWMKPILTEEQISQQRAGEVLVMLLFLSLTSLLNISENATHWLRFKIICMCFTSQNTWHFLEVTEVIWNNSVTRDCWEGKIRKWTNDAFTVSKARLFVYLNLSTV